ncbi:MORN repeat-containing protein 1 isoform X2 [Callorhinchus milii]|uniref:MORN repeat-containing protein 1 isoform X2 n=1 Tax=Callorhinchus milii TaxID=7868 RepID=UPI001C3F627E|nr:MORN repeat-containing protein 1 isoform X2 [Callorhinchus milii]
MARREKVEGESPLYVGEVKHELRDGFGLYIYPNSFFRYQGEWKAGKKHGHGKLMMRDGSYYEGQFVNGEINGNGVRYWAATGNTYYGEFKEGEVLGFGVMKYADGSQYDGEFHYGVRIGHALLMDSHRQTYRGSFHNDKKHGEGEMSYENGDHYQGDWVLDQRQGHGVLHCADGSVYEGQWRNDLFNGQGCMTHCSGIVYDGMWINGRPAAMATKILIRGGEVQYLVQGSPFTVQVELQNDDGQLVTTENGSILQLWIGVRNIEVPSNLSSSFLKLLEDLEEKLIDTPFGLAVEYPLMHCVLNMSFTPPMCRSPPLTFCSSPSNFTELSELACDAKSDSSSLPSSVQSHQGSPDTLSEVFQTLQSKVKVEAGCAAFQDIALARPPPNYRPFMISDEQEKMQKVSKKPISRTIIEKAAALQDKTGENRMNLRKKLGDKMKKTVNNVAPQIVRPGEYIIMVKDISSPPFLGRKLQPGFCILMVMPRFQEDNPESHKTTMKFSSKHRGN